MSARGPKTLPGVRAAIIAALTLFVLAGCAQPIGVRVIDSSEGTPIPGARVTRKELRRPPLWVVGPILPVEQCETDDHGLAHLKDCEGSVQVDAAGFTSAFRDLDGQREEVVISLTRKDHDARQLDTPAD